MKIAVRDNDGTIWGIGNTQTEAMHDAYKWLTEGASYGYGDDCGDYAAFDTYESFVNSKEYDNFDLIDITDAAAAYVDRRGGLWADLDDVIVQSTDGYGNRLIMTIDEENEIIGGY